MRATATLLHRHSPRRLTGLSLTLAVALGLAACASTPEQVSNAKTAKADGPAVGYLPSTALPDSLQLVPPPPASGTAAQALDEAVARRSAALRDTPRWSQAQADADLRFPRAAGTFACALGVEVSETATPHLYQLLRRSAVDLGRATGAAKEHYKRQRPFLVNGQALCTPEGRDHLARSGSYPSGHSSVGWGWALILAEIAPERTDDLLARGRSYGESRNVCNVHWHSDVVQGRQVGAGTVARLHADPVFVADLAAARAEVASARQQGAAPSRDCAAETVALAGPSLLAQLEAEPAKASGTNPEKNKAAGKGVGKTAKTAGHGRMGAKAGDGSAQQKTADQADIKGAAQGAAQGAVSGAGSEVAHGAS